MNVEGTLRGIGANSVPLGQSVVYIIRISKNQVKIGVSRNFAARLKTFQTSSLAVEPLLLVPGDRVLEQRLHGLLAEARVRNELFEFDDRVRAFISLTNNVGLQAGLDYLEQSTPARRAEYKRKQREDRINAGRASRAELNAYYAGLVRERKKRLGW